MDFGFGKVIEENDIILLDACALQASRTRKSEPFGYFPHTSGEQTSYVGFLIGLMEKDALFVSPGVAEEVRRFGQVLPTMRLTTERYARNLRYVCERLPDRVIEFTDEERKYLEYMNGVFSFMNGQVSANDKELLVYGITSANSRGRACVITNDGGIAHHFRVAMSFMRQKKISPKNMFTMYGKFDTPKIVTIAYFGNSVYSNPDMLV